MTSTISSRPGRARELLTAALSYGVAGWPVLPLHTPDGDGTCSCGDSSCSSPGKHPRCRHALTEASTDPRIITRWWRRWPMANIGIRTGDLVVLDIDGEPARRALSDLERAHADEPLPATRVAASARGAHLYLRADGLDVRCSIGRLAQGLDVRGRGGYIVAPPSRHAFGVEYTWATSHAIAPLPEWLAQLMLGREQPAEREPLPPFVAEVEDERAQRYMQAAADAELLEVARAPAGTRNATLNRAAFRLGQLTGAGLGDRDKLAPALLGAALSAGLGEREARATINSGLSAGERHPRRFQRP
jgi:hypothetical protein